jgi:hypothetical protein
MFTSNTVVLSERRLSVFVTWFWRVFLVSFVFMILGSVYFRNDHLFSTVWTPAVLYVCWNLLVSFMIYVGIKIS